MTPEALGGLLISALGGLFVAVRVIDRVWPPKNGNGMQHTTITAISSAASAAAVAAAGAASVAERLAETMKMLVDLQREVVNLQREVLGLQHQTLEQLRELRTDIRDWARSRKNPHD